MTDEQRAPEAEAQAEASPAPEQTETPAPEAPAPAEQPSGPWAKDLETNFQDPAVRAQVDQFLRTTVQPHVTKLEQESAPNRDAQRLWDDFQQDPVQTYLAVTSELFGNDVSTDIRDVLTEIDENPDPTPAEQSERQDAISQLPPEVQEVVNAHQEQKRLELYNAEFDRLNEARQEGDPEIDKDLFHPFVAAANGDFDTAWAGYKRWYSLAQEKVGGGNPDEQESETPPPTIGSGERASSAPPTEKKYDSIDDAIDDFFAEQKSPPPTVGSV